MNYNLSKIAELFNIGKLTLEDAEWFSRRGYEITCADGQVKSIEPINIDIEMGCPA